MSFQWDSSKEIKNIAKHGVSFKEAEQAFLDEHRVIAKDVNHSNEEQRFFCYGKAARGIVTVRFTIRDGHIRIFGAGYWKKGRQYYERENNIY